MAPIYGARRLYQPPQETCLQHWAIFRLLKPLPLTARFTRYSIHIYAVSQQYQPPISLQGEAFVPSHFSDEAAVERFLSGPIEARSPSSQETILLKLVQQGDAALIAGRHAKKTYHRGGFEVISVAAWKRVFVAHYFPDDGWKRVRWYEAGTNGDWRKFITT